MKNIPTGSSQLIAIENPKHVITIILNNPRYMNALSEELTPYLRRILKKISKDSKYKLLKRLNNVLNSRTLYSPR